jgi:hypothetical protein
MTPQSIEFTPNFGNIDHPVWKVTQEKYGMSDWVGGREEGQHVKSSISLQEENHAGSGMNGRVATWCTIRKWR